MEFRLRILKESGLLFSKYGIRAITMDRIAEDVGISKRTLYETFKDKDDLVTQAIEEGAKMHKMVCQTKISASDNVIRAIFDILKLNSETFGKMNPLFFEDLKKYHFKSFNKLKEKGDIKDNKLTLKLLQRGVKEKVFSDNLRVEIINIFIHKIMDAVHSDELSPFTKEEMAKSIFLPYLYGISTERGRNLITDYLKEFN
jgi:TetR/AcrR family transcriptional regulator, cholesterol catabolism regulator